ncbi:MarR family transcriptional regulator [Bacillus sonorensis]|uniref:Transcriptional regulator n=2 Tax=Bacillus sonorensis TaxID=119858 RepID=M5NZ86_9BACI|nr:MULTISPECIES: MarR family transcriptional regulator [Bacillus]TWK79467.1 Transcriptional regulator AdcR [Bacillus paralicheniformis]ASB90798.1 putative HTH-type transcriptional regulator YvnA [Bacillus sonorensis]EME73191.1 transcriptional regulator [Bacillus sonorensis L12]MBG9914187.1 ArsR family transcriptional regulator [Bacillus sonorensis]MCF7616569.1 MarR family transcriptional regulator [Bacillus sonorensis]
MENSIYEQAFQAVQDFILNREKRTQHVQQELAKEALKGEENLPQHWTITQLHIVSLINDGQSLVNNAYLAEKLHVSKAAITKATTVLLKHGMIESRKKPNNNKELYYTLTEEGEKLAAVHDRMHEIAKKRYIALFEQFSEAELETVIRFLGEWSKHM